jgi:hypothetical protein
VGAALFVANLVALVRSRPLPDGPNADPSGELQRAPRVRTLTYMAIGFVVMVWGLASIIG